MGTKLGRRGGIGHCTGSTHHSVWELVTHCVGPSAPHMPVRSWAEHLWIIQTSQACRYEAGIKNTQWHIPADVADVLGAQCLICGLLLINAGTRWIVYAPVTNMQWYRGTVYIIKHAWVTSQTLQIHRYYVHVCLGWKDYFAVIYSATIDAFTSVY